MPEPAFVTRLRTSGGPSHQLLVLLDQHRVLTTSQLARATGTAERTVRYRLDRLREHRLVDCVRPGRETGSAPAHWWLRPAGARLVAGTAAAEGRRAPSGLFVAHAAAIAEVWLALVEHGPAAGIEVLDWWADRAGWQEWDDPSSYTGRTRRLTPDGVLHADVAGSGPAAAFVEVDLASMTQVLLREKVARYLAYAADRAWEGVHPHCPPMLLLTTTATRAATFMRAVAKLVDDEPDDGLVVAACGLVRQPGPAAVVEPVWKLPDPAAAELTLAELLAERIEAQARAAHHHAHHTAALRREDTIWRLGRTAGWPRLDTYLGDPAAADTLRHLVGGDPARLLDTEPELAAQVLTWWGRDGRAAGTDPATTAALREVLHERRRQLWTGHARALLAAHARIAADDPAAAGMARRLGDGDLLTPRDLHLLTEPPQHSREQIQHDLTAAYTADRDQHVARQVAALPRRARRRADPAALAAAVDAEQLLTCDTCALAYPRLDNTGTYEQHHDGDECPHCTAGRLVNHDHRDQVPTLAQRLDTIRARPRA